MIISTERLRELAAEAKTPTARSMAEQLESVRTELRGAFHSYHALAVASGHCGDLLDNRCWGCASLGNADVRALLGETWPNDDEAAAVEEFGKPCDECAQPLGDKYYQDVPGRGDLCLSCHALPAPVPGICAECQRQYDDCDCGRFDREG